LHDAGQDGWILLGSRLDVKVPVVAELQFIVLLQPLASDSLFAPAQVMGLRGNFSNDAGTYYGSARRSTLRMDFGRLHLQPCPKLFAGSIRRIFSFAGSAAAECAKQQARNIRRTSENCIAIAAETGSPHPAAGAENHCGG